MSQKKLVDLIPEDEWNEAQDILNVPHDLASMTPAQAKRRMRVLLASAYMDERFTYIPSACLGSSDFRVIDIALARLGDIATHFNVELDSDINQAYHYEMNLWRNGKIQDLYDQGYMDAELYEEFQAAELSRDGNYAEMVKRGYITEEQAKRLEQLRNRRQPTPPPPDVLAGDDFLRDLESMQ